MGGKRMKPYISLGYGVRFIHNKDMGLILDLLNSKIFIVEKENIEILKKALEDFECNEMEKIYKDKWGKILNFLISNRLIRFAEKPHIKYFHDEWLAGTSVPIDFDNISEIKAVYINFVSSCSLTCEICKKPRLFPCISCTKLASSNIQDYLLNENIINKFLFELTEHGCNQIFITGGDPLVRFDELLKFMSIASKYKFDFFLITNGMLLNEDRISILNKYPIQILLQIVGNNIEYNRKISWKIHLLKKYNIPFQVVLNLPNEFILDQTNKEGVIWNFPYKNKLYSIQNNIIKPTIYNYFMNPNKCLQFKMYLSPEGCIYPCIAFYKQCEYNFGSLTEDIRVSQLIIKLEKVWDDRTLENPICKDCILNNFCLSCVVLKNKLIEFDKCNLKDIMK